MFVWHHHSLPITQYFLHYLWAPYLSPVQLFLFFLFFFLVPKLIESSEKKKKKANPRKEKKKKKVKRWSKVAVMGLLCMFNYNIVIELWVMETENSQKLFSVSITHNLKIRELSDGNRIIVCQINFLLWILPFLSYELWKQRNEILKTSHPKGS